MVRLAGGVRLGRDQRAWLAWPSGELVERWPTVPSQDAPSVHGGAIAVGPADSTAAAVARALDELAALVTTAGVVAAGAGVDLGDGFRSGRLEGASGDRRDAVLAALRTLWPDGVERLGDRMGVVASLFGMRATRRLGAALTRAAEEGRWAAVHLAVAASDLLGPERLEEILELDTAEETDPVPGGEPSTLAGHLAEVVGPLPETRRLRLVLDLWERVGDHQPQVARRRRRERVLASQQGDDDLPALRARRRVADDAWIESSLSEWFGRRPSLAEVAFCRPETEIGEQALRRALWDALAATALLRVARATAESPLEAAVIEHFDLLALGARPDVAQADDGTLQLGESGDGLMPEPGRAGHVAAQMAGASLLTTTPRRSPRELCVRGDPLDPEDLDGFLGARLSTARNHAFDALLRADALCEHLASTLRRPGGDDPPDDDLSAELRRWRLVAGYSAQRRPEDWEQLPIIVEGTPTLAERLRRRPAEQAEDLERVHDLLWLAELADDIAVLYGHVSAEITWRPGQNLPYFDIDTDPPDDEPEPLHPRLESIPVAVAGAAQLVRLGAAVPPRPRSWEGLCARLLASAAVAEIHMGYFDVPPEVAACDGALLPGTNLRVEVARTGRQLADWAAYMGNCIAGYAPEAAEGDCVLVALHHPDGTIAANLELRPGRDAWGLGEFQGRFNNEPPAELAAAIRAWVAGLRPPGPVIPPPPPRRRRSGSGAPPTRRRRPGPAVLAARRALAEAATAALSSERAQGAADALATVAVRLGWRPGADVWGAALAIVRASPDRVAEAVGEALAGGLGIGALWEATSMRPATGAVAALEPEVREHLEGVERLLDDGPLIAALRPLVRLGPVRTSRAVELAMRRIKAGLGELIRHGDEHLDRAMATQPTTAALGAAVLAVTAWTTEVPGRPVTTVPLDREDRVVGLLGPGLLEGSGPWRQAWEDAAELGAPAEHLRKVAEAGRLTALAVPGEWLDRRGWPALWARAARWPRQTGPSR